MQELKTKLMGILEGGSSRTKRTVRRAATKRSLKGKMELVKGKLSDSGYIKVRDLTAAQRHAALNKAVRRLGLDTVTKSLEARCNLNKRNATVHRLMKADLKWLKTGGPTLSGRRRRK